MTKRPEDSTEITSVRTTESPAAIFEPARKQYRGGGIAGSPESAASLATVVDLVRRITRADTAGIATVSPAGDTMTWSAASGFAEGVRPSFHLSAELARRTIAGSEVVILENVPDEIPAGESSMLGGEGVRDVALVPLSARGETLGILGVGYRAAHQFSADEKQTIEDLARMTALALDNARLFETVVTAKKIWEQTFDAIPDGVIVHDDQLRIARCNAEAAAMMGFDHPAEVIGETCAKVFARLFGERAAAYYMRQSAATGAASSFELQAEGGRRYLVAIAPIKSLESGVLSPESSESDDSDARISDSRLQTPDSRLLRGASSRGAMSRNSRRYRNNSRAHGDSPPSGNSRRESRTRLTIRSRRLRRARSLASVTSETRRERRLSPQNAIGIFTLKRLCDSRYAARRSRAASLT